MEQVTDILSQLHKVLKCKMALLIAGSLHSYPDKNVLESEVKEAKVYRATEIGKSDGGIIFYTDTAVDIGEEALELAALYIGKQLNAADFAINLITGSYGYSDIAAVNQLLKQDKELYLIMISGLDVIALEGELQEIINNSLEAKHITQHLGNLLVLVQEQNIIDACSDLQKNILTELFVEAVVAIGGRLEQPLQLAELYSNCIETIQLKKNYSLNQKLLDHNSMLLYRIIDSIDSNLKDSTVENIFSSRFVELLNNEMEQTIEEMFRNNLNLTDTSARLYIHRNTLLYRIDKIQKLTGYDLRKFEDSMIFKLAWLMYKEKSK